ncbi:MAG: sigma-70 family RNA polymerase sigma factor [Acidobacteriota bacterium]|nr:sigma-70 family RNA polymerase sigma factor [Acidobacteriota bacterium]
MTSFDDAKPVAGILPSGLPDSMVDHLFRHHSAKIVASLTRVFGSHNLQLAEDVVQDALIRALQTWPFQGMPENPAAWLTQVAKNRAMDLIRRETVWSQKQTELERVLPQSTAELPVVESGETDDQLAMMLMCCHPAIPREAQLALTLKVACGFSVTEIARALLAQEGAIAKRIVRAKKQIRDRAITLDLPAASQLPERLEAVLHVVYLLFNEGYSATQGENLLREDLCVEAIRLGQLLAAHPRTNVPQVHALLALMMLQAARLPARTKDGGALALLAEQDRSLWDRRLIAAGLRDLGQAAAGEALTRYHLQAEIAALHVAANSDAETDWQAIAALYQQLYQLDPSPIVLLNRAVAVARWQGAAAGIRLLADIETHPALRNYHLLFAVLADLWRQAGDGQKATEYYRTALACNCTEPERQFLQQQLSRLEPTGDQV